jgi:hypothetical protein
MLMTSASIQVGMAFIEFGSILVIEAHFLSGEGENKRRRFIP